MQKRIYEILKKNQVVPVLVIDDASHAVATAEALRDGGLCCVEVTFRTDAAAESIRRIKEALPDLLVGAGSVTSKEKLDDAIGAGAEFVVTPGFVRENVEYGLERGAVMLPGCVTAGEIEQARNLGLTLLKYFPAVSLGGVQALNLIGSVYGDIRFMPTGGICLDNMLEYLRCPYVAATGGVWMAPPELIAKEQYDRIRDLAMRTVKKLEILK